MTESNPKTQTTEDRTPFSTRLLQIDKGRVEDDATNLMADAVRAVELTGKPATVTVTLKISVQDPQTFDETGAVFVEGEAKATLPRLRRSPAIFFTTGVDGQLTRTDPTRNTLFD